MKKGEPLDFPGRQLSSQLKEAVDADLVARALAWAAESGADAAGTYNLTNGDAFLWQEVWPAIAETLRHGGRRSSADPLVDELPARRRSGPPSSTGTLFAPRGAFWISSATTP